MHDELIQGLDFIIWECNILLKDLHKDRQRIMEMKDTLESLIAKLKDKDGAVKKR